MRREQPEDCLQGSCALLLQSLGRLTLDEWQSNKANKVTRGVQLVDICHFLHQGVLTSSYICHWLVQHHCNKWEQKPKSARIQWLTQEIP